MALVKNTYSKNDVKILLQDVEGKVPILGNKEREAKIQSGTHYSEMLPKEYEPSQDYLNLFQSSLESLSYETACAVRFLAERILAKHGREVVLVSLARAGTPIGILLKRYMQWRWQIDVPHYSISIIRGKGIDRFALKKITNKHEAKDIQFLDGWIGKGMIASVLKEEVEEMKKEERYQNLSWELAALSDPAFVTNLYGTREDFLIPSACLNASVTGLISRTVKTKEMTDKELHGAVFYGNLRDYSMGFIESVQKHFETAKNIFPNRTLQEKPYTSDVSAVMKRYFVKDIAKIKPGVGETTRVLLRRIPERILLAYDAPEKYVSHIKQLAKEKRVLVEHFPLKNYYACGLIQELGDV